MANKKTTKKVVVHDATPTGADADLANETPREIGNEAHISETAIPKGKVLVNEDALSKILEEIDYLKGRDVAHQKELEAVADKAKLNRYRDEIAPKGGKVVRLQVLDGKVVVGWTNMPSNICEKNERGLWGENQTRCLMLEDGTEVKGPYSDFTKHLTSIDATVIATTKKTIDIGEVEILTVSAENGKEYEVDSRFIN